MTDKHTLKETGAGRYQLFLVLILMSRSESFLILNFDPNKIDGSVKEEEKKKKPRKEKKPILR